MDKRRRFLLGGQAVEKIKKIFLLSLNRCSLDAAAKALSADEDPVIVKFLKRENIAAL